MWLQCNEILSDFMVQEEVMLYWSSVHGMNYMGKKNSDIDQTEFTLLKTFQCHYRFLKIWVFYKHWIYLTSSVQTLSISSILNIVLIYPVVLFWNVLNNTFWNVIINWTVKSNETVYG